MEVFVMAQAGCLQADVFQIGASCGVVLEFKTHTVEEADALREVLATALDAAIKVNGGFSVMDMPFETIEGMALHEIFDEIIKTAVRPK